MGKPTETLKHKPSSKVVLEDVLASLQDLVSNEFSDESANEAGNTNPDPSTTGGEPRRRGRPRKYPRPEPERAVSKTAAETAEKSDYTYSQEQADLFGKPPVKPRANARQGRIPPLTRADDKPRSRPIKLATSPAAAEKLGQLDSPPEPATLRNTGGETVSTQPKQQHQRKRQGSVTAGPANGEQEPRPENMNSKTRNSAKEANLSWADDIPVLTEVVEPHELNMSDLQNAVDQSLARKDLGPEAREIAVKVAARLNIEARKDGSNQLDVKTIMRLQALLKEALEPKV